MAHRIDQSTSSCFDCIYRYQYTIKACSHTICINCLHAAIEEKIQLQRETFICPRCPDKHESTPVNQHEQQKRIQTLELQIKRLKEENIHLISTGASTNVKIQVLNEQVKKLSIDNANWEKQAHNNELLAKQVQKENEDLVRHNERVAQSLPNVEKDLKRIEEILHKQVNACQTSHLNEINEYKHRIAQLETDNEQFQKEIYQLKQTVDLNQRKEREYNKLTEEIEQYKKKYDDLQAQRQSHENELRQEIERLKQKQKAEEQQLDEFRKNEVAAKNAQIDALRAELDEVKTKHKSTNSQLEERLCQEHEKHRHILTSLLSQDVRNQLFNNIQYFDQCLLSSQQIIESTIESSKQTLSKEVTTNQHDNDQRHIQTNNDIIILIILMIHHIQSQLQSKANLVIGSTVVHHKHILWNLNYTILTTRVDF